MAETQPKVYPSTRYRKAKDQPKDRPAYESVIVQNEEEDRNLGAGWVDTPAAFLEQDDDDAPAKPSQAKTNDLHDKAVESTAGGFLRKK